MISTLMCCKGLVDNPWVQLYICRSFRTPFLYVMSMEFIYGNESLVTGIVLSSGSFECENLVFSILTLVVEPERKV